MDELRSIVSELNKAPFTKGLTLVTLDEKNASELLQLVVDVLGEIDAKMKLNTACDSKESIIYAIVDFVAMLNYKVAIETKDEFQTQLSQGSSACIVSLWQIPLN